MTSARSGALRQATLWLGCATLCALMSSGCATGKKLEGQADEIKEITDNIRERAYRCAPRELAIAESSTEFGRYELKQGNFVRAREHLNEAETHAKMADKLSAFPECGDKAVAMNTDATPKAKVIEAKPTPKDRDGDGLLDEQDKCPDDPEDFDGFEDADGCPDKDNDQDGVPDDTDQCPDVPEDADGYQDEDGCPELDNDGDGIADINDQCKDKAEDFDGFQDEDGCPDADNDNDQIADVLDQCPMEAEDYDNDQDDDGCPEERKLVKVEDGQIKLGQQVFFKTDKDTILPVSFPLLDEVAAVLTENMAIKIRIEGHTDNKGKAKYNKKLSQRRAESVRKYLIKRGISADRMTSAGFGMERPIEDNSTEAGRAANRRVEIHITSQ
jgi:OmpA-OmpF porin, OOP family